MSGRAPSPKTSRSANDSSCTRGSSNLSDRKPSQATSRAQITADNRGTWSLVALAALLTGLWLIPLMWAVTTVTVTLAMWTSTIAAAIVPTSLISGFLNPLAEFPSFTAGANHQVKLRYLGAIAAFFGYILTWSAYVYNGFLWHIPGLGPSDRKLKTYAVPAAILLHDIACKSLTAFDLVIERGRFFLSHPKAFIYFMAGCIDAFIGTWVLIIAHSLAAVLDITSFVSVKTGFHSKIFIKVWYFITQVLKTWPTSRQGGANRIELKRLSFIRSSILMTRSTASLTYSTVKFYLPSLEWSEDIIRSYTDICIGTLIFMADRVLTGLDAKMDQSINFLYKSLQNLGAFPRWSVTTAVRAVTSVINGSVSFVLDKKWLAWTQPSTYMDAIRKSVAGMPSCKLGIPGRVTLTRLNFVADYAIYFVNTASDLYNYARSWIPTFLLATTEKMEDFVLVNTASAVGLVMDVGDKMLTLVDIKVNKLLAFSILPAWRYLMQSPGASFFIVICWLWYPVYASLVWMVYRVLTPASLADLKRLEEKLPTLWDQAFDNNISYNAFMVTVWGAMPASKLATFLIKHSTSFVSNVRNALVLNVIYGTFVGYLVYIISIIIRSAPYQMAGKFVYPKVSFITDPFLNRFDSELIIQCMSYWAPTAAVAVL